MVAFSQYQETTEHFAALCLNSDSTQIKFGSWVYRNDNERITIKVPESISTEHNDMIKTIFMKIMDINIQELEGAEFESKDKELEVYQLALDNAARVVEGITNTQFDNQ